MKGAGVSLLPLSRSGRNNGVSSLCVASSGPLVTTLGGAILAALAALENIGAMDGARDTARIGGQGSTTMQRQLPKIWKPWYLSCNIGLGFASSSSTTSSISESPASILASSSCTVFAVLDAPAKEPPSALNERCWSVLWLWSRPGI